MIEQVMDVNYLGVNISTSQDLAKDVKIQMHKDS